MAMDIHETIKELLHASFSMRSLVTLRKAGDYSLFLLWQLLQSLPVFETMHSYLIKLHFVIQTDTETLFNDDVFT